MLNKRYLAFSSIPLLKFRYYIFTKLKQSEKSEDLFTKTIYENNLQRLHNLPIRYSFHR